jgi:hypothetical protein
LGLTDCLMNFLLDELFQPHLCAIGKSLGGGKPLLLLVRYII